MAGRAAVRFPSFIAALCCASLGCAAVAGCARQDGERSGAVRERSGSRGALEYRLRAQVDPARVTLGEAASWRLSAELPSGARVGTLIRGPADSTLDLTPVKEPSAVRREGGVRWACEFQLRGFNLSRIALPRAFLPVELAAVRDTLEFPPETLYVDSLTTALTGTVEPDRGPLPTELRPLDYAVAMAGVLALVAVVALAIVHLVRARRRAGRKGAPEVPSVPPEERFLRTIEALRAELERLPRDEFHDRLSLAIREYVESRTGIPARDRTTAELEQELRLRSGLRPEAVSDISHALRRSDLAKFARKEDSLIEARGALDGASSLAGRLMPPALTGSPSVPSPAQSPGAGTGGKA